MSQFFIILLLVISSSFASTSDVGYTSVTQNGKPWFEIKSVHDEANSIITYTSGSGELLAEEKLKLENGHVISYDWNQLQTKERITLNASDRLIRDYKGSAPLIFPPLLTQFLQKSVKNHPKEKSFPLSVVAPDKGIIISFHFVLKDTNNGEIKWELRADSFFVRLMFSDLFFIFNKEMQILRIENIEFPIKLKVKNHFESKKTNIIFKRP